MAKIELGDVVIDVTRRDIKNVHLSVYPPHGSVRLSAPLRMSLDTIRLFAIDKLAWIRQQQKILRAQERETPRELVERESHYLWGKRYLLTVIEEHAAPSVHLRHSKLQLHVRPGTDLAARESVLAAWYRQQIKDAVPALLHTWAPRIGVAVPGFYVQQMRTRWGSSNPAAGTIRLNTELAKKPRECLEYIVVHELLHLLEPTHGARFVALMDQHMPEWRGRRELLNRLPLRHEGWGY